MMDALLTGDKDLRTRSLFEVEKLTYVDNHYSITLSKSPLYEQIGEINYKDKTYQGKLDHLRDLLLNTPKSATFDNAEEFLKTVNAAFYLAKGYVFTNPQFYEELQAISHRAEFSRAFTLVCITMCFLYFMMWCTSCLAEDAQFPEFCKIATIGFFLGLLGGIPFVFWSTLSFQSWWLSALALLGFGAAQLIFIGLIFLIVHVIKLVHHTTFKLRPDKHPHSLIYLSLAFAFAALFGSFGYGAESRHFNERVFAYRLTMEVQLGEGKTPVEK
jgi:hypothetical protein